MKPFEILALLLLLSAFILFLLASKPWLNAPRFHLNSLGLACATAAFIIIRYVSTIVLACALIGCASTSTAGLTKDQIAAREKQRTAWSQFGMNVANTAVGIGTSYLNRDKELSRTHKK